MRFISLFIPPAQIMSESSTVMNARFASEETDVSIIAMPSAFVFVFTVVYAASFLSVSQPSLARKSSALTDNPDVFFEQTYIALSSMMLSAAMLNIDSCAIGGMDKKAVEKILVDRNLMDTDKFQVTLGCAFGYRVHEAKPKLRQSMNEVVTMVK